MNLHLLVPFEQHLHLFRRPEHGSLYQLPTAKTFTEALDHFYYPEPRLLLVLGNAYPQLLPQQRLESSNFCLIPESWLRHIAPHHVTMRAQFAVQLLEAFLFQPIRLHICTDSESSPFQHGVPIPTDLVTFTKHRSLKELR